MIINSPISQLSQILKEIVQAASQYEPKFAKNEAATRAALIDPLLNALGWNATVPDMVEFERVYGNTRLDYALYDSTGKVQVIIEAKSLGTYLNDTKTYAPLLSYSFTYGIPNVFLTDGILWQHFFQATPGNMAPTNLDLKNMSIVECAHYFVDHLDAALFWNPILYSDNFQAVDNKQTVVELISKINLLEKQMGSLTSQPPVSTVTVKPVSSIDQEPLSKSTSQNNFVMLDKLPYNLTGHTPPKFLRLPDGSILAIKTWRMVLEESCKYVLAKHSNLHIPMPDKAGKKVKLLDWTPPPENIAHIMLTYQGKQVYIFLNYSANNCVANARHILNLLPPETNPISVAVAFE